MEWLDITGKRQVAAACVTREEWAAIVKVQPAYALADIPLPPAGLYGPRRAAPGAPNSADYTARLLAAGAYVTGVTWHEAALFCNALGAELKLEPVYALNGTTAKWASAATSDRGKVALTEFEEIPGSKGVRLLTAKDRREAVDLKGFLAVDGLHEWSAERRRAPQVFEGVVLGGPEGLQCNSTFRIPWHAIRVVRG
jgi:formylglycine-generating enzyme required for sulfatase activity